MEGFSRSGRAASARTLGFKVKFILFPAKKQSFARKIDLNPLRFTRGTMLPRTKTAKPLPPIPTVGNAIASGADATALLQAIVELRGLIGDLVGKVKPAAKPFLGPNGDFVQYVSATELSRFLGKKPRTLLDLAERGIIPGCKLPTTKASWVFDLFEVYRVYDSYKRR